MALELAAMSELVDLHGATGGITRATAASLEAVILEGVKGSMKSGHYC